MNTTSCVANKTSLKKAAATGTTTIPIEETLYATKQTRRSINQSQHDKRESLSNVDMHTSDGRILETGAVQSSISAAQKPPTDSEIDKACAAHAEGVRQLLHIHPPKRASWDQVCDRERVKRSRLLCLQDLEGGAVTTEDNEEEDNSS